MKMFYSKSKAMGLKRSNTIMNYPWLAPAFIIYALFLIYPMIKVFYFTFFEGKLYSRTIDNFVGFDNFAKLFSDPRIWQSFKITFIYIGILLAVKIPICFLLALLLHKNTAVNQFTRTLIFLPTAVSMIVTGIVWNMIYHPLFGLLNNILKLLHLDFLARSWLGDTGLALISVAVIDIWHWIGFGLIIFTAGIQNIPGEVYEAGKIDGTNKFTENIYITLPLLKPVFIVVILFLVTSGFKAFEYVFATTGGGPLGATSLLSVRMYQIGFMDANFTYGCTVAALLFIITFIISGIFLTLTRFGKEEIN